MLPFGRGRSFFGDANRVVNGIIGGWQLSGIYRWNSGLPVGFYGDSGPFDNSRWATNWNVQSNVIRIAPVTTCPDRGGVEKAQDNLLAGDGGISGDPDVAAGIEFGFVNAAILRKGLLICF